MIQLSKFEKGDGKYQCAYELILTYNKPIGTSHINNSKTKDIGTLFRDMTITTRRIKNKKWLHVGKGFRVGGKWDKKFFLVFLGFLNNCFIVFYLYYEHLFEHLLKSF